MRDTDNRIDDLILEAETLPKGSVSVKNINGHIYHYHRWYENGKKREKYVSEKDVEDLREAIARRRELEREIKE